MCGVHPLNAQGRAADTSSEMGFVPLLDEGWKARRLACLPQSKSAIRNATTQSSR